MKIVAFDPGKHSEYLDRVFNNVVYDKNTSGVVAEYDGKSVGIFLLKSWTENAVQIHVAIQMKMCLRTLIPEMFKYVFQTCDRKLIYGLTPADKPGTVAFNTHLGFRESYRIKDGIADGVDTIIFEMRRDECRYLLENREAA